VLTKGVERFGHRQAIEAMKRFFHQISYWQCAPLAVKPKPKATVLKMRPHEQAEQPSE